MLTYESVFHYFCLGVAPYVASAIIIIHIYNDDYLHQVIIITHNTYDQYRACPLAVSTVLQDLISESLS